MVSMSGTRWTVFCLLLLGEGTAGQGEEVQCSLSPAGALHPVQGLLERFVAGPGCAARETGATETHVIAVGKPTHSADKQVTVVLRPLSVSRPPHRALVLVLSSLQPLRWWLEAQRLPPGLPVLVQVSVNSTVRSSSLPLRVQPLSSLPFRPRPLLRWAQRQHGGLSSLTHSGHANRVHLHLGEDPNLSGVCQLQSLFLSHNYITSDLQTQEVRGCTPTGTGGRDPEVHVIKLHSAGSGLCGSLQVEVAVSLVPPVANAAVHDVVLILSSAVPVNWAVTATGLQGHVSVHSSNSVSPPYPPEPYLTLSSRLSADLSSTPDLLAWANESGFPQVTSYTEADLANRFVIQLAGGGTGASPAVVPLVVPPPWTRELRQGLRHQAGGGREAFSVQCQDGRLSVAVDTHSLQTLAVGVAAVTLRDPKCQAQYNGSHFLLAFPVISCGTEGELQGRPRGVQYKNMVLLWRDDPQTTRSHNKEERTAPLGIHFSCFASLPSRAGPADDTPRPPQLERTPWGPQDPDPDPGPGPGPEPGSRPRPRPGPVLSMHLFVTEGYEQRPAGPCIIMADQRIYVELSARWPVGGRVEVRSCVVSPHSDPKSSPSWTVVRDGCSTDPSFTLSKMRREEEEEEEEEEGEEEEEKEEGDKRTQRERGRERARTGGGGKEESAVGRRRGVEEEKEEKEESGVGRRRGVEEEKEEKEEKDESSVGRRRGVEEEEKEKKESGVGTRRGAEEETHRLRFSFVLRPVHNNSVQFLHCSLGLCGSGSRARRPAEESTGNDCLSGPRIPPLVWAARTPSRQCERRNLSRPVLVTQPISPSASGPLAPPADQRAQRPSISQLAKPGPEHSSSVVETGPVLGIVFAAFALGSSLRALWCIYTHAGIFPPPIRRANLLESREHSPSSWNPPVLMEQSNSYV